VSPLPVNIIVYMLVFLG